MIRDVLRKRSARVMKTRPYAVLILCLLIQIEVTDQGICQEPPPAWAAGGIKHRLTVDANARSRNAHDPTLEMQVKSLILEAKQKVINNQLEAAVLTQRDLIFFLDQTVCATHWLTIRQRAALSEYERVLTLAEHHRDIYVAACRARADGNKQAGAGNLNAAEKQFQESLAAFTSVCGEQSLGAALLLEDLGTHHLLQERSVIAKQYFERSAIGRKAILGEDHPDYSEVIALKGAACQQARDLDNAEALFRKAAILDRKSFSALDIRYINVLGSLASTLALKKQFLEAESLCLQAISLMDESRQDHLHLRASLHSALVDVHIGFNEWEKAEYHASRALALFERNRSPRSFLDQLDDKRSRISERLDQPVPPQSASRPSPALR